MDSLSKKESESDNWVLKIFYEKETFRVSFFIENELNLIVCYYITIMIKKENIMTNDEKDSLINSLRYGKLKFHEMLPELQNDIKFVLEVLSFEKSPPELSDFAIEALKKYPDSWELVFASAKLSEVEKFIPKNYWENKETLVPLLMLNLNKHIIYFPKKYSGDKELLKELLEMKSSLLLSCFDDKVKRDPELKSLFIEKKISIKHMPKEYREDFDLAKDFCKANILNVVYLEKEAIKTYQQAIEVMDIKPSYYASLSLEFKVKDEFIIKAIKGGFRDICQYIPKERLETSSDLYMILSEIEAVNWMEVEGQRESELSYYNLSGIFQGDYFKTKYADNLGELSQKNRRKNVVGFLRNELVELTEKLMKEDVPVSTGKVKLTKF